MVQINPLRALRPTESLANRVVSLPYDVMDQCEARQMAQDNPHSFLRIIRSDLEFGDDTDPYSEAIYQRASDNLANFEKEGWLVRESESCYYIYRLNTKTVQQTGLVAGSSIWDYQNDIIKKHEFTRPQKELDRTTHIDHLGANTGPVFLMYRDQSQARIAELMDQIADTEQPLYDLSFADGVQHRLYRIGPGEAQSELSTLFADLDATYIADGHHRAASAFKNGLKRSQAATQENPQAAYNSFLLVIFPDSQLAILPYNRALKDLNGLSSPELMDKIKEHFEIREGRQVIDSPLKINMYFERKWYSLEARTHTWQGKSEKDKLAVSILQNNLLGPVLAIEDPRTSDRISFIGGIRGDQELEKLVQSGKYQLAFSMPAVAADQIIAIADAGDTMPPKSTWFEPKLRSGFVTHLLDR